MHQAYAHPSLYDILHTPGTAGEVDLLMRCLQLYGDPGHRHHAARMRWLEPACGTGRYLRVLAGRGHRCVAFDLDPGMIDYARQSLARRRLHRRVRLLRADMADFLEPLDGHGVDRDFDAGFVLVNSIRHLTSARAMQRHLEQMNAVLRPGGLYVVGISFSRYGEEEPSEDVWIGRRGRCSVRQIVQYLPPDPRVREEMVFSHLQVDRPSGREYLDSAYPLRSYSERQWTRVVTAAGFERVGALDDLGNVVGREPVNYQLDVLRRA